MKDNVRFIPPEGMPEFFNRHRCVYVLGQKAQPCLREQIVERLKCTASDYEVYFHNAIGKISMADYVGGDVLSPLFYLSGEIRGYVVGDSGGVSVAEIAEAVASVAESNEREYLEDLLMAAAFNSPVEFNRSVRIFGGEPAQDDPAPSKGILYDISGLSLLPLGFAALGINADFDSDLDFDSDACLADGIDTSELSADMSDYGHSGLSYGEESIVGMSNKKKRLILSHLPDKLTERFIRENPECSKDIEALFSSVSYQDLKQLCYILMGGKKGALQIFDFTNLSAASEYELHIRKWDKKTTSFDRKFHYCVFLKDKKGHEIPVKFLHRPAYCLYVMYAIDRAKRGDNAQYLSLRTNREEFIHLYQALFGAPYVEAEKKYKTFAYRLNKEGQPTRRGRYDDYLKDIDSTIVNLVGRADSIPLKLRNGGHIELLPEKIKIDRNLLEFQFE